MFITALYTIARTCNKPKCPIAEEWIKKIWYIYTMEYYSVIKSNKMMSFAEAWIDLETVILSETNQKNKNKYCVISIVCGI